MAIGTTPTNLYEMEGLEVAQEFAAARKADSIALAIERGVQPQNTDGRIGM
jgi:hypothetical protein